MALELPISRQSSIARTSAFMSAELAKVLATISMASVGFGPATRRCPRLHGRTSPANIDHESTGGEKWAVSGVEKGASARIGCRSGVSRDGSLFQKKVASPPLFRIGIGVLYCQT